MNTITRSPEISSDLIYSVSFFSHHISSSCRQTMPPPPIPQRKGVTPEVKNEGSNPPPIPVRSPRRRPAGAVATAMVSGQGNSGQVGSLPAHVAPKEVEDVEDQEHANNPYDLKAAPGSSVTASYPFRGDDNLQQLSFAVSENRAVPVESTTSRQELGERIISRHDERQHSTAHGAALQQ